jgi:hypothetical protein
MSTLNYSFLERAFDIRNKLKICDLFSASVSRVAAVFGGQPASGGPPSWGLGVGLQFHHKNSLFPNVKQVLEIEGSFKER